MINIKSLQDAAKEAGMTCWLPSGMKAHATLIGRGLKPPEITQLHLQIEDLVCSLMDVIEHSDDKDAALGLHNAIVWEIWQAVDLLSTWAGGHRQYGAHSHEHGSDEQCADNGGSERCARNFCVRALNRLLAEVENGACITDISIDVINADGSEVSYCTGPDSDGWANPPLVERIIHAPDHDGCIDATVFDVPDEPEK
jgi:hypothetical protein